MLSTRQSARADSNFPRWKELGRHVRKGEKALTLRIPVSCKAKHPARDQQGQETEQGIECTRFVYRNHWFVLAQTEGAAFQAEPLPDWDETRALAALAIEHTPFDELDGNIQSAKLSACMIASRFESRVADAAGEHSKE